MDRIFTNDEERMQAQAVLDKIAQQPAIPQARLIRLKSASFTIRRGLAACNWLGMRYWHRS